MKTAHVFKAGTSKGALAAWANRLNNMLPDSDTKDVKARTAEIMSRNETLETKAKLLDSLRLRYQNQEKAQRHIDKVVTDVFVAAGLNTAGKKVAQAVRNVLKQDSQSTQGVPMSFAKVLKAQAAKTPIKKTEQAAQAMVLRRIVKKAENVQRAGGLANALGTPRCN